MGLAVRRASPTRPRRFRRWLARLFALFMLVFGVYHGWVFWQVWRLREHNPPTTSFMQSGLERLRSTNPMARLQRHWVPYEQISEHLKRAVIVAEDQKFLDHEGFDVEAIQEAFEKNARGGASATAVPTEKSIRVESDTETNALAGAAYCRANRKEQKRLGSQDFPESAANGPGRGRRRAGG